jgi:hypothetical protein
MSAASFQGSVAIINFEMQRVAGRVKLQSGTVWITNLMWLLSARLADLVGAAISIRKTL